MYKKINTSIDTIFIFTHMYWIVNGYFYKKNKDTIVTTSAGTSSDLRNRVLHKGERDAESSITSEETMEYSFPALNFLLL